MNIGEAIRIVRSRKGLRQRELAERLGLNQSFLSLVEKGKRQPTLKTVEKIARAMTVPPQLILLLACETPLDLAKFKPALQRLSLDMLDLLAFVEKEGD